MNNNNNFENLTVSTATVIAYTNAEIDLAWLYKITPIFRDIDFIEYKTKNSYKKQLDLYNPPAGSIIMIQYKDMVKGMRVKKKSKKPFRNALSIVIYIDKPITIRVPIRGKLHMTGCNQSYHPFECIKVIWNLIKKYEQSASTYILHDSNTLTSCISTVMTDIIFSLDMNINVQNLDRYINVNTDYYSLLETSSGYPGANVKIKYDIDMDQEYGVMFTNVKDDEWTTTPISFSKYLDTLPPKEKVKQLAKRRENTLLCFYSGKVIISGLIPMYMKDAYYEFMHIISGAREQIEEKLKPTVIVKPRIPRKKKSVE